MSFYVTNNVAKAEADAIATATDAGTQAVLEIYSGTLPVDADASAAGLTLLASLPMSATAFGAATDLNPGARITAAAITADSSADATGTATCWRVKTQTGGTATMQGECGIAASGKELILNTVSITAGSNVSVTAMTITQPEGP